MNTLMSSPLVDNKDFANNTIGDIVSSLQEFKNADMNGMQGGGSRRRGGFGH